LESFLLEYSYKKLLKKSQDNTAFNFDFLSNQKIKDFLIKSMGILKDYLINFKKMSFKINVKRPSQITLSRHHLKEILNVVPESFILELSTGMIARVISNYNKLDDDSISVNIFSDIGNILISKYYYSLYKEYIIIGIEQYCNECKTYIDSNGSNSNLDIKNIYLVISNIKKNKDNLESYELLNLAKKIIPKNILESINLNNTESILDYTLSD